MSFATKKEKIYERNWQMLKLGAQKINASSPPLHDICWYFQAIQLLNKRELRKCILKGIGDV